MKTTYEKPVVTSTSEEELIGTVETLGGSVVGP